MKLLVIEDNDSLRESIGNALAEAGMRCELVGDFESAREKIALYQYDVLVVDINLPDGSGLELIRLLKERDTKAGVIVVSARDSLENKLEGLDLGADDYLTKPFDMAELIARINALFRRRNLGGSERLTIGSLVLDTEKRAVFVRETLLPLTKSEYNILAFFMVNPNRVLTRETIAEHIWGDDMDLADSFDFIYSHMKNIRKKVTQAGGEWQVKSVYGVGYKLEADQ